MTPGEYFQQRFDEVDLSRYLSQEELAASEDVTSASRLFMTLRIERYYSDVTPEVTRRVEQMLSFFISFLQHTANPTVLANIDKEMGL